MKKPTSSVSKGSDPLSSAGILPAGSPEVSAKPGPVASGPPTFILSAAEKCACGHAMGYHERADNSGHCCYCACVGAAPATPGPVLTERVPCPAVWDCYGDGAMRCCREDGHEGWHRPSVFVWEGILDIAAVVACFRADAAEAEVERLTRERDEAMENARDGFARVAALETALREIAEVAFKRDMGLSLEDDAVKSCYVISGIARAALEGK